MPHSSAPKNGTVSGPGFKPNPGRRLRHWLLPFGAVVWLSLLVVSLVLYGQMGALRAEVEALVTWLSDTERTRLMVASVTKKALQSSLETGELEVSRGLLADCRPVARLPHPVAISQEAGEAACGAFESWLSQLMLFDSAAETPDHKALSLAEIRVSEALSALVADVRRQSAETSVGLGRVWTAVTVLGVVFGSASGLLGILFLAGRRETELLRETNQAIEESERRFRAMADGAPVMIWMSDLGGRDEYFNQPWLDFAGIRLEDARMHHWHVGVHPEDLERCLEEKRTALNARRDSRLEYRRRRFDGEYRWMLESSVPRFSGRDFVGCVGSSIDISELKHAQTTLEKSKTELESRVEQRTAELKATNRALEHEIYERKHLEREVLEIDRLEQERIGGDLHDGLAQQLVGASLFLKSLEGKLERRHLPEAETAREIGHLVSDAISQARALARGLAPAGSTTKGLREALEGLAADAEILFGVPCHVRITCDAFPGADTTNHLFRIAQEAVHNAAKHAGGTRIDIEVSSKNGALTIEVIDDGAGLPAVASEGEGIGLRLMRHRASLVEASLSFRQGVNGGTIVACRLPEGIVKLSEAERTLL